MSLLSICLIVVGLLIVTIIISSIRGVDDEVLGILFGFFILASVVCLFVFGLKYMGDSDKEVTDYTKSLAYHVKQTKYTVHASTDVLTSETKGNIDSYMGYQSAGIKTDTTIKYIFLVKIPGKEGWVQKIYEGEDVQHIPLKNKEKSPYIIVTSKYYTETAKSKKLRNAIESHNVLYAVPDIPSSQTSVTEIHYDEKNIPFQIQYNMK